MASVIIGDYEYKNTRYYAYARVVDKTKTQYDDPLASVTIDGTQYPVESLDFCFNDCAALRQAPTIPNSVESLEFCFSGCTSLIQTPTIPNSVKNMQWCFEDCTSLTQAPTIPVSVGSMVGCFKGCTALKGNIEVYNAPTSGTALNSVFSNTTNDIYIINKGSGNVRWKTAAGQYNNVHYEADDNPAPVVSNFKATRVSAIGATTFEPTGLYAYIQAKMMVYDNLIPVGWTNGLKSIVLKDNGSTKSPTWQPAISGFPADVHCWIRLGDTSTHQISLQISDSIKENNTEVVSKDSVELIDTISKSYALVDYYHDSTNNTEGMAIGKYAESANLLDVDMPTTFRQSVAIGKSVESANLLDVNLPTLFRQGLSSNADIVAATNLKGEDLLLALNTAATSGVDKDIYDGLVALGWDSDVIV